MKGVGAFALTDGDQRRPTEWQKMASHTNKYSTHIINQKHLHIYKHIYIVQIMKVGEKKTHAHGEGTAHARGLMLGWPRRLRRSVPGLRGGSASCWRERPSATGLRLEGDVDRARRQLGLEAAALWQGAGLGNIGRRLWCWVMAHGQGRVLPKGLPRVVEVGVLRRSSGDEEDLGMGVCSRYAGKSATKGAVANLRVEKERLRIIIRLRLELRRGII